MPRVSVVIPTYGRPHLVCTAVASVLAQTMTDLEVIVVVDGPDPATVAALENFSDPRLTPMVLREKGGAARARDAGVGMSRGAWVAFLDDDDAWMPGKLAAQLAHAPAAPAIVSCLSLVGTPGALRVMPPSVYDGAVPVDEWLFDRRSWFGSGGFLQCSSLLVSRSVFEGLRFSDTRQHDDWEFVIRAVRQGGCRFAMVPEPLVEHLFEAGRVSLQSTLTWRHSLTWAERMRDAMSPRAVSGFLLTVAARSAADARARGAALPLLAAAFRTGRPTARQLLAFALLWLVPRTVRGRARRAAAH